MAASSTTRSPSGAGEDGDGDPSAAGLIDPSLLSNLTESERKEALEAAAAARRAEERAERRALERAMEARRLERERERAAEEGGGAENGRRNGSVRGGGVVGAAAADEVGGGAGGGGGGGVGAAPSSAGGKVAFVSRKRRAELARERERTGGGGGGGGSSEGSGKIPRAADGRRSRPASAAPSSTDPSSSRPSPGRGGDDGSHLNRAQIESIKKSYLGESAVQDEAEARKRQIEQQRRRRAQKKITFKFEWDASEDTSKDEADPLYDIRGGASSTIRDHHRRGGGDRRHDGGGRGAAVASPGSRIRPDGVAGLGSRRRAGVGVGAGGRHARNDEVATVDTVSMKPLSKMTPRDWRIYRENYDIVVKGGKAPPPLRSFRETPLGVPSIHPALLRAIEQTLRYKEPSPIQRQAIPIGLQRRDLIGIAETGSGKTAAFGIPLCHLILSLPTSVHRTVAENGPLALVMAPTRELALQIDAEVGKLLSMQGEIKTIAVVGGQPIQQQAYKLRDGVHVVVGTPGRINDCVEMAYLVLNQCSYIVLDEADRMIDLGFAPQIEQILDAMGGLLKSENETEAYEQERKDLETLGRVVPRHRLTAMFSATMPPEVERIAKRYLRHPAVVTIGDQDSGKNARIVQRVLFLSSPAQKQSALNDILRRARPDDKIIVFVNEKKHADGVGRMVEKMGRRCVVLHGGKTQEQREENLSHFRRGGAVLVATDVAGRGLDIPDVSHVVNFDVPSRSIDNYCHRIGRTGRAGKEGHATSFITDADEGIMAPLKSYLESTGMPVPDRLARHPAAVAGVRGGNIR